MLVITDDDLYTRTARTSKSDTLPKVMGMFAFEIAILPDIHAKYSTPPRPGWLLATRAKYVIYHAPVGRKAYVFKSARLKDYYERRWGNRAPVIVGGKIISLAVPLPWGKRATHQILNIPEDI